MALTTSTTARQHHHRLLLHSGLFLLVGVALFNGIIMVVTNAASNWLCSVDWEWLSWVIVVLFVVLPLLGCRNQYQGQLFPPCHSSPP